MKKLWLTFLPICIPLLLSGCKLDMIAELRLDDVKRVAANEDSQRTAQANFTVKVDSEDECEEYASEIIDSVRDLVIDVWTRGCENRDDGTYLLINFKYPIVHGLDAWQEADILFGVAVHVTERGSVVLFVKNLEMYQVLEQRLSLKYGEKLNLPDSTIRFLVRAFLTPHVIVADGVFAHGKPVDGAQEINIKRRERIGIQLSNVGATNLELNGSAIIFFLQN